MTPNLPQRVFVFEHLCGGGVVDEELPTHLVRQGKAMLLAALRDLQKLEIEVTTLRDPRVELPGVVARVINDETELLDQFDIHAAAADATLVIAPECDDLLGQWLSRLDEAGLGTLNVRRGAATVCGDKRATFAALRRARVPTPDTWVLDGAERELALAHLAANQTLLIKPRDGVGCEHIRLVRHEADVPIGSQWLAQSWHPGQDVSISAIGCHGHWRWLPAGRQHVKRDERDALHYRGGTIPLPERALDQRLQRLAEQAFAALPGLAGFVGVDAVLGAQPKDDVVIEINPRLTMSYVGLSALCQESLALAWFDSQALLHFADRAVHFDPEGNLREKPPV